MTMNPPTALFHHPPRAFGPIERRLVMRSACGDRDHDTGWLGFQEAEILRGQYLAEGWEIIGESSRFGSGE